MDCGAQKVVQEHVAGGLVGRIVAGDAGFELYMTIHAKLPGCGCSLADEIRLHRPGDQRDVRAQPGRFAEVVLELPGFVATKCQPGAVIALDVEFGRAIKSGSQVGHPFDGGGDVCQVDPGKGVEGAEGTGHWCCSSATR